MKIIATVLRPSTMHQRWEIHVDDLAWDAHLNDRLSQIRQMTGSEAPYLVIEGPQASALPCYVSFRGFGLIEIIELLTANGPGEVRYRGKSDSVAGARNGVCLLMGEAILPMIICDSGVDECTTDQTNVWPDR